MAGLRWWNYVNDEGQSVWNFESSSAEDQIKFSKAEIQIFWFGLILFPVIWVRFDECSISVILSSTLLTDLSPTHSVLHVQAEVGSAGDHEPGALRVQSLRISQVTDI